MAITFTKKQVQAMAEVLDDEHETVEDAAKAALEAGLAIAHDRMKFAVVGQLVRTSDGQRLEPTERSIGEAVMLDGFATAKQAHDEALKLTYSTQTHEEHRAWVLPTHWGSAHDYYRSRKDAKKATEAADRNFREAELQRRIKWFEDNPGESPTDDWGLIPFENELEQCPMCDGLGRIKAE